jgi:anti-sigma regulatory factor (Ser/Thr protein kinase)
VPGPDTALLQRPIDHHVIAALRADVRRHAAACGLGGRRLDDFLLAVNEIVANAVQHGDGERRLLLWQDGDRLVCEVSDQGPGLDDRRVRAALPSPGALGGRGLWLARRLTDSLIVTRLPRGTVVRLSVRCGPGPSDTA